MPRLIALVAGAGCLAAAAACAGEPAQPVQVIRVVLAPSQAAQRFAGVIRPRHEAAIAFRAGGRITERLVDVGDRVKAGDVLARLDPTDLALAVQSAEANLASAQAVAAQAEADAGRYGRLVTAGNVSASENGARQAAARTAREQVAAAEAALRLARNQLGYAVLAAPESGVVTAVLADPGTVVAAGTPVLRLADAAAPEVDVALPESALPELAGGDATFRAWAQPDVELHAHQRTLAPQADSRLGTYDARFTVLSPPPWLALGMTVRLELAAPPGPPVATLPLTALTDRGHGPIVWSVDAATGALTARPVSVVALRDDKAEVAGLRAGELVVGLGVQKLDPGAKVRVACHVPCPP